MIIIKDKSKKEKLHNSKLTLDDCRRILMESFRDYQIDHILMSMPNEWFNKE